MKNFKLKPHEIVLAENAAIPAKVQIFKTGLFKHSVYGDFEITPDVLLSMKKNFDEKVRGVDIAIDYAHDNDNIAAAWLTGLELSEDGQELWALPAWTPKGKRVIEDKEFRYLSPEFNLDYKDPESGKKFGPTLLGAGLTNRPYIKNMAPAVELTEITKEEQMTIQELEAKVQKLSEENQGLMDAQKKASDAMGGMSPEEMMKMIADLKAQVAALQGEKELAAKAAEEAKMCAEKEAEFTKLLSEGKAVAAQKDAFMKDDFKTFIKLAEKPVLTTEGHGNDITSTVKKNTPTPAQDEVIALAEKLVEDKKAKSLAQAQGLVLNDPKHADLAKRVQEETQV